MAYVHAQYVLRPHEVAWRVAVVVAIAGILTALRLIDPATSSWFPLRTSCGAISGLPCLFCGTTRAMHHLLNGEFARTIYFNWLAIPVFISAVTMMLMIATEVALRQHVLAHCVSFRLTSRRVGALAGAVVALWVLQITLAVSLHKHELLNPAGPLYPFFVR
jgi:hypothetical protein